MRLDFFAAGSDLIPAIKDFEKTFPVQYLVEGVFEQAVSQHFDCCEEISNIGFAEFGHRDVEKTYLVIDKHVAVNFREIQLKNGGISYSLDLMTNPTGISFRPSGIFGGNYVIDGFIGTATKNKLSERMFKNFSSQIKSKFVRIHNYFVGPKALELMDDGWRLTYSTQTPFEFDLKR